MGFTWWINFLIKFLSVEIVYILNNVLDPKLNQQGYTTAGGQQTMAQVKFVHWTVFVNEVLFETDLFVYCLWLLSFYNSRDG